MDSLKSGINSILDKKVTYSRTGGGVGSILLIKFENECKVWAWRYWEISKGDQLIACSEDDDKKEWLSFETLVLLSSCILPFLVKLLIKDPLPPFDTEFWSFLLHAVLIMMSLNLGFMLWKDNEWYKLWGWFLVAFFICSFVISNVYAFTSIRIGGFDGWMYFWGLFAFVFLIYSSIIAAPLAAIAVNGVSGRFHCCVREKAYGNGCSVFILKILVRAMDALGCAM